MDRINFRLKNFLTSTHKGLIFSIFVFSFLIIILPSEVYSQKTNNSPLPFNQAAIKQATKPALQGPDASKPYFIVRFALPIAPDNDKERNGHLVGIDTAVADHHHSPGFEIMAKGGGNQQSHTAETIAVPYNPSPSQPSWGHRVAATSMPSAYWQVVTVVTTLQKLQKGVGSII
jgi:hypothetical protein